MGDLDMINREAVSRVLDNMTPAEWESFQFHFEQIDLIAMEGG